MAAEGPLRVLLTNNRLDRRGGAEAFARELAAGLLARGHAVALFSSGAAPPADPPEGLAVARDPDDLPFRPDVIHAQHHLDTMTALTALPGVPALYHCHGAVWRDAPPRHPRIHRYLAMSPTLAERIVVEAGIEPARVEVLLNTIDLARFATVREPPARPRRALFYHAHHRPGGATVEAVSAAAAACGLRLELAGFHLGGRVERPEALLPRHDLVFASGRSAVEALACGCAVVTLGRTSCGTLVTPERFDAQRRANFSLPVNAPPPAVEAIVREIRRFTPEACAAVTRRIRREADSRDAVARLVAIYREIVEGQRRSPPDPDEEMRALSRYLRRITPLVRLADATERRGGRPLALADALREVSSRARSLGEDAARGARIAGGRCASRTRAGR